MARETAAPARKLLPFLIGIGGVYTAQSLVGGVTFIGLPTVLREQGVALDQLGLVSLLMIPWALKFLWAPMIERWRTGGARDRSRRIIWTGQALVALAFAGAALAGPDRFALVFAFAALMATVSASIDIACDGFAIANSDERRRGWVNIAQVGGGYSGMALGAGLFLALQPYWGWAASLLAMAAVLLALNAPFGLLRRQPAAAPATAPRASLLKAFANPRVRAGLLIALLFEAGVRLVQPLAGPFLVDRGASLELIGALNGVGGVVAGLIGAALGGVAARYFGAGRALTLAAAAQALTLLLIAAAVWFDAPVEALIAGFILKSAAMAFGFVTLYSHLMNLASRNQPGVDFSVFQSADALMAGLAGFVAGQAAHVWGYGPTFGLAAAIALCALAAMPVLIRLTPPATTPAEGQPA